MCHLSDKHTQVDQVDDLLHEVINEVEIDSHGRDTVTDIENRLRMLRQNRPGLPVLKYLKLEAVFYFRIFQNSD